jgi:C4-dicarboxylate transporter DctM subunit
MPTELAKRNSRVTDVVGKLRATIPKVESWILLVILAGMTLLPTIESVARRLFDSDIPGSILYTQHLTLWVGFLGALMATGRGNHLSLATRELIPAGRLRGLADTYVALLSTTVCVVLAWASAMMVQADAGMPSSLPGGVPEWLSELVMPVALGLMALRFAWRASDRWLERTIALVGAFAVVGLLVLGEEHAGLFVIPFAIAIVGGLLLGAPVFVGMAGMACLLFFADQTPVAAVPAETFRLVASPTLPAIPLLTVAGYILAEGGASQRLLRLARALVGWAPGGLAVVVCMVCAAFTALTGGSGVTILALGGLVLPMLAKEGYPEKFRLGLVTTSGSLGLVFPPSLPVILYAVVAQVSISELFIAGLLPGILLLTVVCGYGVLTGVRADTPRQPFVIGEALAAVWQAKWELSIPMVVALAIFTGFATIVEAAALTVILAAVSQCLVFKDLHPLRELPVVLGRATSLVGAVLILLGVAMGLTSYLVDAEIPSAMIEWTQATIDSPIAFLLLLNITLLVLGSILEVYSAIIILAPLVAPMAASYGIDPLHMGVVFLINIEVGFLFPPMGLNLIISSTRFNEPLARLYRVTLPFLLIQIVVVLIVTYVPGLTTGFLALFR